MAPGLEMKRASCEVTCAISWRVMFASQRKAPTSAMYTTFLGAIWSAASEPTAGQSSAERRSPSSMGVSYLRVWPALTCDAYLLTKSLMYSS